MTHSHRELHRHHRAKRSDLPDSAALSLPLEDFQNSRLFQYAVSLAKRTPPSSGGGSSGGSSSASSGSSSSDSSSSDSSSSSSSSSSCGPKDNSPRCQKPTSSSSNTTIPIVLGVVVPLTIAMVIFLFLHRRHVKKLRNEDANDKHGSLDFGMGNQRPGTKPKGVKKGRKDMAINDTSALEKDLRRGRGLSMDMAMGSPYLLPPNLQNSRESLHSLSRTIHSGDDRYRTAMTFTPGDSGSVRSFPASNRRGPDDASTYTGSSGGVLDHNMNQELLRNASGMPRSSPPHPSVPTIQTPEAAHQVARKGLPSHPRPSGLAPPTGADVARDSYIEKDGGDMRRSNNYLGAFISPRDSSMAAGKPHASTEPPAAELPMGQQSPPRHEQVRRSPPHSLEPEQHVKLSDRQHSMEADIVQMPDETNYLNDDDQYGVVAHHTGPHNDLHPDHHTGPHNNLHTDHHHVRSMSSSSKPLPMAPTEQSLDGPLPLIDTQDPGFHDALAPPMEQDDRRLSVGFRPLPPEDPTDDPEQRANRIRSFYKEYFDDSKPAPAPAPAPAAAAAPPAGGYYEDFDQDYYAADDYYGDAAYYDPDGGNFVMPGAPYAEPVTRRAMTPPPRAPPRFQGPPRGRHGSFSSGLVPPGPRPYSSASGPMYGRGRQGPRKPMPPPSPLRMLPTPHMLREDSFALPIDFAPPKTYKDRQGGRPESPRGGMMPYQPAVPAHLPLASSFDDLSAMPSPHAMRKSGTFTGLDFAPPPRFKFNEGTASDAGSIRSNRSAMSQQQLHSIRSGAYRVSRIPKEMVGTKNELANSLRPQWDMKR